LDAKIVSILYYIIFVGILNNIINNKYIPSCIFIYIFLFFIFYVSKVDNYIDRRADIWN
jgi:hypothetical protein